MPGPAGPSPKLLGRIAAGLLALVFIGIVWWAMGRGPSGPTTSRQPLFEGDAPDITELETGESIVITLADKDDPGRVAGIIEADRFDPVGNGQRELLNPRGWLYPKDGRVISIRADRGVLTMPTADSSPEAGTLEGDVRVRVFESSPAPGVPPADDAEPVLTADFDEPVQFERRYLRLSTPGAFRIDSERVSFDGSGLAVMLNGVRDRIELIDVERGGRMEIRAASDEQAADQAAESQATPEAADPIAETPAGTPPVTPPSEAAPDLPKIDMYRAVLDSEIVVTLGTTRVEGDRLELFTRVRDNALADDAITPIGFSRSPNVTKTEPVSTDPDSTLGNDDIPATTEATTENGDLTPGIAAGPAVDPNTLVLVWQGQMTIRPIAEEQTPPELTEDDAALALFGDDDEPVRFRDDARGVVGDAGVARYAATRGVFTLEAGISPVNASIEDAGSGTFARVDANLVNGTVGFTGEGSGASQSGASLAWTESGVLTLATDVNGDLTDRLTAAEFTGGVRAEQRGGVIESETLAATFGIDAEGRAALRTARIGNGSITGDPDESGRPRSLSGNDIKVDFVGDAGSPRPVRVEANGTFDQPIAGAADGSTLSAERAVATLATDAFGDLFIRTANASGNVAYTGENDTSASGKTLEVDGSRETIRLTGADSSVAQGDSAIEGADIRLDARTRQMNVEGAGRFEHTLRSDEGFATGKVVATWRESMRFDDALGRLLCLGGVSVVAAPDPYTRDTLSAERIEVEMTPRLTPDRIGRTGAGERELHVARAYGGASSEGPVPATAKTTKYDPSNPEFVTGTLYLESDQIIADARNSELRVPGKGTLLVLDRRGEEDQAEDQNADGPGGLGPGLTRFGWDGSMTLDRDAGVGTMNRNVTLRHKALAPSDGRSKIADLLCDTLTASFGQRNTATESQPDNTRFVLDTLDAQGNVLFVSDGRRLEADGANYDAARELLHTLALPGRLVTLTEPGRATPLSARAIMWDLVSDQIEINQPSPVTLPGG